jgi:hypothetical protein
VAVSTVTELWTGRTGEDNHTRHRTYTRTFEVYCDSNSDDPTVAGGTVLLPRLGDAYPTDAYATCVRIVPTQDDADPLRWVVSVDYDTQPDPPQTSIPSDPAAESLQPAATDGGTGTEQLPGDRPDDPLSRPTAWRFSFQQTSEVAVDGYEVDDTDPTDIAVTRTPILLSSGLPLDPPVMVEVSRPIATVTKNFAQWWIGKSEELQDAVNDDTWKGFGARVVKVLGVDAQSAFENGASYWQVTFTLGINRKTWDKRLLNAGYSEKRSRSNPDTMATEVSWERIKDVNNNPITEPVPLDVTGQQLPTDGTPTYRRYCIEEPIDFDTKVPL